LRNESDAGRILWQANPSWDLSKKDTKKLVDLVANRALPSIDAVESILGFRGYILSAESDDVPSLGLPHDFRLGGTLFDQIVAPLQSPQPRATCQQPKKAPLLVLRETKHGSSINHVRTSQTFPNTFPQELSNIGQTRPSSNC